MDTKATYTYNYPHPAVTTDCVVFGFDNRELNVLLIKRGIDPFKNYWALPGGFMRIEENAEDCVRRELKEETGLTPKHIEQFYTYTEVDRDPRERVITIAFYSLVNSSEVTGGDDASDAKWFRISELPQLAFDHYEIYKKAYQTLQQEVHFKPICFELMDEEFSIPNLQRLYETILNVTFDRRNFQKKILALGILEEVDNNEINKQDLDTSWSNRLGHSYYSTQYRVLADKLVKKDINELFLQTNNFTKQINNFTKNETDNIIAQIDMERDESQASELTTISKRGKKWRFLRNKYDDMKTTKPFRLEF